MTTTNEICNVCHGKGGWRTEKKDALHYNWMDCPYCDGLGFKEVEVDLEKSKKMLTYAKYCAKLKKELSILGENIIMTNEVYDKDMYIRIEPTQITKWKNFIKHLLKYSYYANTTNIDVKQCFYYEKNRHKYYWELIITMDDIDGLEGFVDLVRLYNESSY